MKESDKKKIGEAYLRLHSCNEDEGMTDEKNYISQEETLNKINALIAEYIPLMPTGWTLPLNIAKTINELPSVTPQPNKSENPTSWIPVTERLPEKEGYYLVTATNRFTGEIGVFISWFGANVYEDGKRVSKWCDNHTKNTIAWMSLPEPYEAESEVNTDEDSN